MFSQDKQIQILMNWIQAKGYETQGPLVVYSSGITELDSEGAPIVDSRIMIQLKRQCAFRNSISF